MMHFTTNGTSVIQTIFDKETDNTLFELLETIIVGTAEMRPLSPENRRIYIKEFMRQLSADYDVLIKKK